ncbi:hypothetical protein DFH27DRAFT_522093 [Peziza echinospora]|nr:hypothetical protein DFH27DRAFT_522093 [Peziza echinospora]
MQSSPSNRSPPEETIPSPPNTPASTAADDRHRPHPFGHLDTHLYQQKKRREFAADTSLQRTELRIDHDSGPQQKQGMEGKKHKKSASTGDGGGEKSTAPGAYFNSRFLNHLSHYPVLTDTVSQITSHAPQSIVSFIKTYSPNPPADGKNTLPLIGTLDTIGDSLLTTIDTYFPVLAKPTPELIDDTVKNVKRPVEGIWNVYAMPVVGTLTNPVVGRVNDILVDLFKPQEIIRQDKRNRKKQWKEQQKLNKQNPHNPHNEKSSSSEKPSGRPKTYAEASAAPPPGAKQQQQKQAHKNPDHHYSTTDDSDNQAQYKRNIKQQNQHDLQLQRTYQIFTSILHDTQNTIRDPQTRIYKLPIVGGVVHKAASWVVPEPPHRWGPDGGQGKKKKGGNYPEKHTGPTNPSAPGGALDGGESREKYEFAGVAGSEGVTVIGGGREGMA